MLYFQAFTEYSIEVSLKLINIPLGLAIQINMAYIIPIRPIENNIKSFEQYMA